MTTILPALLVASLAALVGSVTVAAAVAATRMGRSLRLAVRDGEAAVDLAPTRLSWTATVHGGVLLGLALLLLAVVLRTIAAGHAPWSNLHEFSQAFALALLAGYAVLERRHPVRGLAPIVALLAAGLIALALSLDARIDPLVPALQQPVLLTVHVGAAVLAYAISGLAFAAAVGELLQRHRLVSAGILPDAATCRAVAHRSVLVAFPVLTAAIVLGSVWANLAWRSYWSNDPKELAAAATWLVYAGYLHVALRRDRWAAVAPWLLVLGFGAVLFTYLGAGLLFVGEHSYAAP